jgi:uridine phosphorylase
VPHVKPTNPLAPRAVLVGDPGRALALAQQLVESPLMFNHHRGLWGYTGVAPDGDPLTIQATGIGGPSAAVVLGELIDLGLQVAVRAGTCRGDLPAGTLIAVDAAIAADGASRALGAAERVLPDPELAAALTAAAGRSAVVRSSDVYGSGGVEDLSTAAVLQLARVRGIRAAAVLAVVEDDADEATVAALGRAASAALLAPRGAAAAG